MVKVATGQLTIYDQNDSKQAQLFLKPSLSKQVLYDGVSVYNPTYATGLKQIITPDISIAGSSTDMSANVTATRWYYQVNSTGAETEITVGVPYANHTLATVGATNVKALEIAANVVAANNTMRYICEIDYRDPDTTLLITMTSDIEIIKIATGVSATVGNLTNDSIGIPCNADGTVISYTGAVATFSVYKGVVQDTGWSISKVLTGCTTTETDNAATTVTSKTATINGISASTATVVFTATKANHATITKTFSLWKSLRGTDSKVYEITPSVRSMTKSEANAFTPATVTATATSIQGAANPVAFTGRYKIYESVEATPSTFALTYTSSADEASKQYTPTANAAAIKIELYAAGGTTTLLDVESIAIVKDGFDAAYLQVWIPEGNDVKNGVGSIKIKADLYKGANAVTPTSFAWYYLNNSSVWTVLNVTTPLGTTGYTTNTLTVPASFIEGTENFKCIAVYDSVSYSGVTTVRVIDDPIICDIFGGNIIRNGANNLTLTAKILREGVDIDPGGTLFTYEWALLNPTTLAVVFDVVADTKTVTILPEQFTGMCVAQCVATEI